jgi:3',5'-cyclic AMP phosphodiesterase CpdA
VTTAPQHILIQFSDIHITPGEELHEGVDTLANITEALAEVERSGLSVEALLFSGDLADTGDIRAYRRLRQVVEPAAGRLGVPFIYAMGNHDERGAFRAGLLSAEPTTEDYDHVTWIGGLRVIVLDSTVPGFHHGEITDAQLDWLRAELTTPAANGTVLVLHHPPIPLPIELEGITLKDPERLGEALADSDVKIILSGHAHHSSAGLIAGIPVWVAGATAYRLDVLSANLRAVSGGVYTRVDVYADTAVATDVPVGAGDALYEITPEQLKGLVAQHSAHA